MFHELSSEQSRQLIDAEQTYAAFREVEQDLNKRFAGGMTWRSRGKVRYLYRKIKGVSKSLGRESEGTIAAYKAFREGRTNAARRHYELTKRLDEMAPVNRALRLGRVPLTCAKVLKALDSHGLLGREILVVGTNAMFAYEAAAGVHIEAGLLATLDVDLMLDERRNLKLLSASVHRKGLIGILNKIDRSFKPMRGRRYRAANTKGYMVDLISPQGRNPLVPSGRKYLGSAVGDIEAAEIAGLIWLLNAPKFEAVAIGENGWPIRMVCPDPRAFAAHKIWLARQQGREPIKKRRDKEQGRVVKSLLKERLPEYPLDPDQMTAIPKKMVYALLNENN